MQIEYRKTYLKRYKKLSLAQQRAADLAIYQLTQNPKTKQLRLHKLRGIYNQTYSISAGGDLRLHFVIQIVDPNTAIFVAVGTHAQLYG